MSVKFGTDGTIYCDTVKYNWKQARNMIADGTYGNITGDGNVWTNVTASTSPAGYKCYRAFDLSSCTSMSTALTQSLPAFTSGHKYYLSFYTYATDYGTSTLWASIYSYIYNGTFYLATPGAVIAYLSNWSLLSTVFTSSYTGSDYSLYVYNPYGATCYVSKFILIDLTDTFGSGNEPTQEWCDSNIREHEVFCNFGCVSNHITPSTLSTRWTGSNLSSFSQNNYLSMDASYSPREYQFAMNPSTSYTEGYLTSTSSFTLTNTNTYYFGVELNDYTATVNYGSGASYDCYFPIAEPVMGQTARAVSTNRDFNGGGSMQNWKRVSMYNTRTSFDSGSYQVRFDYNNNNLAGAIYLTGLQLTSVNSVIPQYNNYNGTSITISDVNKEWCDRWIDGRSSPIIHIKDPNNTKVEFNTDYDIICNDIEIRPELNCVKIDPTTGTIYCKKLVRTKSY